MRDHETSLAIARESLDGLSVGDALGESLSYRYYDARDRSDFSAFREGTVPYTDDSEMAIGIFETLSRLRAIDQDALAQRFSARFMADPERGYGRMARKILREIATGRDWRSVSSQAFGKGSFGNGAAMRVAPLGAYLSDDVGCVPEVAKLTAEVTHYHPEGIAGAVAVAVGSAAAASSRQHGADRASARIWEAVLDLTPESEVCRRLKLAHGMRASSPNDVARSLGNGTEISAQDTVPFCIWSACRNLGNYREAFFTTVETGGDCDTNCAIVGGIVSAFTGTDGIPVDWLRAREPLQIKR